jgi:hypothetical protein
MTLRTSGEGVDVDTPADARAVLAALEAEEQAARTRTRRGWCGASAETHTRLHLDVLAACDRVLRERVAAALEDALEGHPLPATSAIDSALPLLRTGVCGG